MQDLKQYINDVYNGKVIDFITSEIEKSKYRVNKVIGLKNYLCGVHKILERADGIWKGEEYKSTKLILHNIKSILNFHDTYLLGKPISLNGTEGKVKVYNNVYRKGRYNKIDFDIIRKVNRYGDVFEYLYIKDKQIKSKLINSENGFPIYSEDTGEYIGFIEYYTIDNSVISFYNIYYPNMVEMYSNEGGDIHLIDTKNNLSGLPVHYHNYSDYDENYGRSEIEDIKPVIDMLEDILSKMADAVYTLSLNPIAVSTGQKLSGQIDADVVGYCVELDAGEFKFANAQMDYSTIKLLLDTLEKQLSIVASVPSVALGNSNISNVSEVSLSMLYNLSEAKAMLNEKWLKDGFIERWDKIEQLLCYLGVKFIDDDYIDCEFNYSKPINKQELMDNLEKQFNMGAISVQTVIEKSGLTNDVAMEINRLKQEGKYKVADTDNLNLAKVDVSV